MDERMTVAAAQLAPAFMDREACVAQVCAALREAGAEGAVVGSALYTGDLTLEAAMAAARGDATAPGGAAP